MNIKTVGFVGLGLIGGSQSLSPGNSDYGLHADCRHAD